MSTITKMALAAFAGLLIGGGAFAGAQMSGDDGTVTATTTGTVGTVDAPGDVSGPCDEAEHANDPRCTGAGGADDDIDNSGPGSHNSGPGNAHDDDDDRDDDSGQGSSHSGSGHGGDDHGGDDSDHGDSGSGSSGSGSGHSGGSDDD
jgi:hypothetical protein